MKYQIKEISPFQTSKVSAVIYLPFSLIYTFFGILMLRDPETLGIGVFFVLAPIWLVLISFVMTFLGCLFYNFFASLVGGIEFDLEPQE